MAVTRVAVGEELWAARPWWRKACPGKNPVEIRCRLFSRVCVASMVNLATEIR